MSDQFESNTATLDGDSVNNNNSGGSDVTSNNVVNNNITSTTSNRNQNNRGGGGGRGRPRERGGYRDRSRGGGNGNGGDGPRRDQDSSQIHNNSEDTRTDQHHHGNGGGGNDNRRGRFDNRDRRPDRDRPDRGGYQQDRVERDRGQNERFDRGERGPNERFDRGDRDRGPRREGYGGGGGRGGGGHRGGARPRDHHHRGGGPGVPASEQRSNTLVIKDADNEFLRMLKQANDQKGRKAKEEEDKAMHDLGTRSGGHRHPRDLQSMQSSRVTKAPAPEHPHKACPVCLMDAPSLTGELVQAITSCEHIYCFECALRLIFITNKEDCPICRQTLTKVVLTRDESLDLQNKEVREFLTQGVGAEKFKKFDKMVYLDYRGDPASEIFELTKQLLWFNCPYCVHLPQPYSIKMSSKNETSYEAISRHLRKHSRNLCDLCFFNLELFPYEYDLYTDPEMDQHKRLGSSVGDAQVQHRMCHLCPTPGYYFNNEALANHCKEAHISCYVCNSQTIFFIDQPSLVEHVVEQHICCPVCRKTNGQIIGFLSVIELKSHAHVEHPGDKIDYETLAKQSIANATANASYGFDLYGAEESGGGPGDSNMSRREAFDVIDNLLRNRFSAERHLNAPSFNPKTENYILNFPGLEGQKQSAPVPASSKKGSKGGSIDPNDVHTFPGSKYRMLGGKISGADYEEQFPGLGGGGAGGSSGGSGPRSIASAAANVKYKPQNWAAPNQLNKPAAVSAKEKPAGKKGKGGPRPPPVNPLERDLDDGPTSIYDDMIYTNPLEAPQTLGQSKPKSVQLIESISSSTPINSNPYQTAPPPIEAFPALGRPSKFSNPAGIQLGGGGTQWSKALSGKPKAKPQKPKPQEAPRPKDPLEEININDDGLFPGLSGGGGSARPSWMGPGWADPKAQKKSNKKKSKQTADSNEWHRPGANGTADANGAASNGDEPENCWDLDDGPEYQNHLSAKDRNNELRRKIRNELSSKANGDESTVGDMFNTFKDVSLTYRGGKCTADHFFEFASNLLGKDFLLSVMNDLISLLPDIAKQKDLYARVQKDSKFRQLQASTRAVQLWSCEECGQLSIPAEKAEHLRCHQKNRK